MDRNSGARGAPRQDSEVALLAEGVDRNIQQKREHPEGCPSPSSRRAWIEMALPGREMLLIVSSPSSRRAWIEMLSAPEGSGLPRVALLAEGVDRNGWRTARGWRGLPVALLAEGVDRNSTCTRSVCKTRMVALLAEGVDRNLFDWLFSQVGELSPSSRRAWIEIRIQAKNCANNTVALLAEGVDRNTSRTFSRLYWPVSPSSRRAWIEIHRGSESGSPHASRPPRGGRG